MTNRQFSYRPIWVLGLQISSFLFYATFYFLAFYGLLWLFFFSIKQGEMISFLYQATHEYRQDLQIKLRILSLFFGVLMAFAHLLFSKYWCSVVNRSLKKNREVGTI